MFAPSLPLSNPHEPQPVWTAQDDLALALEPFLAERTLLIRIAYRVTCDISAAEDVVQEAWLRWQHTDRSKINNPTAFLTTITTRLAINAVQSAWPRHA